MMRPSDLDSAEKAYHEIIKELDLDELRPSDRIKALRDSVPSELLLKVKQTILLGPVVDIDTSVVQTGMLRYKHFCCTI